MIRPIFVSLLVLALAGCAQGPKTPATGASAGDSLEQAAIGAGIVADPATLDPVGAYASENDRVCVLAVGKGYRIGASVDYGEQQNCLARGTARGRETITIDFGDDCRFEGKLDGERLTFPASVPPACERRCNGRATFAALNAPRLSATPTEARAMRGPDGAPLCS